MQGSGGFKVTPEMEKIMRKPGLLRVEDGGQKLRELYQQNSAGFDMYLLSPFAQLCYTGQLDKVMKAVESGNAPDITGVETPYGYGYATLTVSGGQRLISGPPGFVIDHIGVLKYLFSRGMSPDVEDILGYTALDHCTMALARADLARVLLEHGADVNHRDRFGSVPVVGAFQNNAIDALDVLMEFGADLSIADADDVKPDPFYLCCGPQVTAAITRWKRKRAGESAPLDEKKCLQCGKTDSSLKLCSKCLAVRYCSRECQRANWSAHKATCRPFNAANAVTVKPRYHVKGQTISLVDVTRKAFGHATAPTTARDTRAAHVPKNLRPDNPKGLIVKVQVPWTMEEIQPALSSGDLMVYSEKRELACSLKKADDPEAYKRIVDVVRSKGVRGAKAYFAAELKTKDELVIKIGEVLAEQPF